MYYKKQINENTYSDKELIKAELFALGRTVQEIIVVNYSLSTEMFKDQSKIKESLNEIKARVDCDELVDILSNILISMKYSAYD